MIGRRTDNQSQKLQKLRRCFLESLRPPSDMTVSEWAEKNIVLRSGEAAETGPWRTDRAPYQKEPMDAFTQPGIREITLMWGAQLGKTAILNNMIGRAMDLDPGPIMMIQNTEGMARDYAIRRLDPMISGVKTLRDKIGTTVSRKSTKTLLMKVFPGGSITIIGGNTPAELRSRPIRYLFIDEASGLKAGTEGDPVELAQRRTATFYNKRIVKTSTPLKKGDQIDSAYRAGTQEEWRVACPGCGQYHFIAFKDIHYQYSVTGKSGEDEFVVTDVKWRCPSCGALYGEHKMKRARGKWVATRPEVKGARSFKINTFYSPWERWENCILTYLKARAQMKETGDDSMMRAFVNTILGEPYEEPEEIGDIDAMMARRENYDYEVPDGVLVLTCGVDTQDNRLEYEVVGWGRGDESWGIQRGFILGDPSDQAVWDELDGVLDREWEARDGLTMTISATFVDSGGHNTEYVYEQCRRRNHKHVYAIHGVAGADRPCAWPSSKKQYNRITKRYDVLLINVGVDIGKRAIMNATARETAGAQYMHFPIDKDAGYDRGYFKGLFSEEEVTVRNRGRVSRRWIIRGTKRNEALDCRNYARAAFKAFSFDLNKVEKQIMDTLNPPSVMPARSRGNGGVTVISRGITV